MKSRRTTHSVVGSAFGALFSQRRCLATVFAVVNAALAQVASGQSVVIEAGSDGWVTPAAGATEFSFALSPIPADFFGPGSNPFDGLIVFRGAPLETDPSGALGLIDTVVERLADTDTLEVGDTSAPIPTEIVALSLVSTEPITVTFSGGQDPQQWDVKVCLSSSEQMQGLMTITRTTEDGGTFNSTIFVNPLFIFEGPGGPLELDCGVGGLCGEPLFLEGEDNDWVLIGGPGGITRAQLGVSGFGAVPINSDCDVTGGGTFDVTTQGVSNFQGGFADAGGGEAECQVNEEAEKALAENRGSHDSFGPTESDTDGNGVPDDCEGACCLPDWTCDIMIEKDCQAAGGTYLGNKSTCGPEVACCLPDGSCKVLHEECCTTVEGGFVVDQCLGDGNGNGTDDACEVKNCCFTTDVDGDQDIDCLNAAPGDCPDPPFIFFGDLVCVPAAGHNPKEGDYCVPKDATPSRTDCFEGPEGVECISIETGACCFPDATCDHFLIPEECIAGDGIYAGDGTICLGDINENGIDDACEGPVCGDNVAEGGEACDGTDDDACPGECQADCTCPIPTVSEWGLIVMVLLALTAGTIVFARRRRPTLA